MEPMTKDRLLKYQALRMENDLKLENLARLKSAEQFAPKMENDGSKHQQGASDRMANAVLRRMEYQDRILDRVNENLAEMEAIENAVNSLADPLERIVLNLRYISSFGYKHMPWAEIAKEIYGDDDEKDLQAVFRLHGRALKSIGMRKDE